LGCSYSIRNMMEIGGISLVDPVSVSLQQRANVAGILFNPAVGNLNHLFEGLKNATAAAVSDPHLPNDNPEDEGEIMLLAMILLQLNGVKLPPSPLEEAGSDSLNKKKRQRTSPEQLAILEQIFQTDKMPNQQTRVHLADQLGMSSRRVQIWFQNKRAKVKRGVSKMEGGVDESAINMVRRNSTSSNSSVSSPQSPSSPSVPSDDVPSSSSSSSPSSPVVPQLQLPLQLQSCNNTTSTIISTSHPTVVHNNNHIINASSAPTKLSCEVPSSPAAPTSHFTLSAW